MGGTLRRSRARGWALTIPPFEQAILDLTKLVGDVVEEQKKINAQLSQKIDTMENNVNKRIDGLRSEMEQYSISKLAQHLDHLEEESQEEECLSDTMVEDPCLQQPQEILVENFEPSVGAAICLWEEKEATFPLTEKSSGHETVEGTQEPIIQPNPIDLDPNATAQPKNNPLLVPPSADQVYILPTLAEKSKPAAPAPKGKSNPPLATMQQNFMKLVAIEQAFGTTSNKMATAYIAWHSGWFGFGAPGPRHF